MPGPETGISGVVGNVAAHAVEIAGDDIEQLHQPLRDGTERLDASADAAISNRGRRVGELVRDAADFAALMPVFAAAISGVTCAMAANACIEIFQRQGTGWVSSSHRRE